LSTPPVICFGQQPCGFFPRRFLWAKIATARRLQAELGGEIVFFWHDSDHDPRETQTILRHRKTGEPHTFNFNFVNKTQRKWTPLAAKRIPPDWAPNTARSLGAYAPPAALAAFKTARSPLVGGFCLEVYRALGLLDGVRVVRSADPAVRAAACDITDCFVDVTHEGETVRARRLPDGSLCLHEGGDCWRTLPAQPFTKEQVSPARDSRLRWMQSVVRCTHYIAGAGEQAYLNKADAPEIVFVPRDPIDRSDEAWIPD